ncbi:tRNA-uridine aminocarboxypropyltransferase [Photobacterium leiognathi]|uniref:tRNA-uridine aminocarboxypropyltransferase n=1 Tax=Photobacterium leiognathi TaxID=553611 RepID=UPI002980B464|nr:DTW domain-containing protein [Photobacterium leiognathi]
MSRYCDNCGKANKACICHWIKTIETQTELWILQHPSEVKRAIGTARILSLSLSNSRLWVGEDFSQHDELNQALAQKDRDIYVVYPGEGSIALSEVATQSACQRKKVIILLDGTWKKAYKMWQLSTNLHHLPLVSLDNVDMGNYRIRKSPKEQGVSTVEAGFLALSVLESEQTDLQPLLDTFDAMINFQIAQMPSGVFEKNYQSNE